MCWEEGCKAGGRPFPRLNYLSLGCWVARMWWQLNGDNPQAFHAPNMVSSYNALTQVFDPR